MSKTKDNKDRTKDIKTADNKAADIKTVTDIKTMAGGKKGALPYGALTESVLAVLAAGSVVALAVLLPGVGKLAVSFVKRREFEQRAFLRRTLKRLGKRGLVVVVSGQSGDRFRITQKGRQELARLRLYGNVFPTGRTWDGAWRIVMFDVKEERKFLRDRIRFYLKQFGFRLLQDSAWIYPYECEEVVELIRTALNLRGETIYLTCRRFVGDESYQKFFKLTSKRERGIGA